MITIKNAVKWSNALRSGKYKQGYSALQFGDKFCCLGVGCKIFIPPSKLRKYKGSITGGFPMAQEHAPNWLQNINEDLESKIGISFSLLNDGRSFTFDEIADVIDLVYVYGAID